MSHVTRVDKSRHTCGWHVTRADESHHTCEWVTSHVWTSHVTGVWMSHVTGVNESRQRCEWVTSQVLMSHDSHVWHDSFICVSRLIHACDMTDAYVWWFGLMHISYMSYTSCMTHSYAWHNSFLYVTWLICIFKMIQDVVRKDIAIALGISRARGMFVIYQYVCHISVCLWYISMFVIYHMSHTHTRYICDMSLVAHSERNSVSRYGNSWM